MATVFLARDVRHNRRVAVSVKLAAAFEITGRQTLFGGPFAVSYLHASYGGSPDGRQFLLLKAIADAQTLVVVGWRAERNAQLAGRSAR